VLHISPHTVDTHRRKIMEKLELHNVVDLVKFAIRHGLASLE
jgi:two-component system NarL family response regulator